MPVIHDHEAVVARAVRLAEAAQLLDVPIRASEQNPARLGPTVAVPCGLPAGGPAGRRRSRPRTPLVSRTCCPRVPRRSSWKVSRRTSASCRRCSAWSVPAAACSWSRTPSARVTRPTREPRSTAPAARSRDRDLGDGPVRVAARRPAPEVPRGSETPKMSWFPVARPPGTVPSRSRSRRPPGRRPRAWPRSWPGCTSRRSCTDVPVAPAGDQHRQLVAVGAERLYRPGVRGAGDGEDGSGAVRVQLLQPGRTAGGGLGVRPARQVPGAEEGPGVTGGGQPLGRAAGQREGQQLPSRRSPARSGCSTSSAAGTSPARTAARGPGSAGRSWTRPRCRIAC